MDAPQRTQKRSKVLKQIINSTYIPIIIAKSRIIAEITLYRYIFDFLEFQKFEKTATFPRIARHWYINNLL